ncbi:hypothetical protein [Nostoc sp. CHAB 5715]|uniref:hypothetical protein n=1 Tax=Nostoc sp. CHAB 5715 TaxID=2780400 RepID=UPI001E2CB2CA|nr:hypothetical protein [Nostoc sp. CHAB 5715]MCC5620800.1 hypothetical protein [Nostoc sp. CHAB 5715]
MTFTPRQRITLDGKTYLLPSDILQQIKALTKGYEALVLNTARLRRSRGKTKKILFA